MLDNEHLPALHRILAPKPLEYRKIKWTDEKLCELSVKLDGNLAALRQQFPGAYNRLEANPELSRELFPDRKRHGYWNVDTATKEAATCSDRAELRERSQGAYNVLRNAGLLEKLLPEREREPKWTEAALLKLLKTGQFKTRTDFFKAHPGAYEPAKRLGLLDKWLPAIVPVKTTLEEAIKIAKTCDSRTALHAKSLSAYLLVQAAGLLDELLPTSTINWTDETIRKYADQFTSRSDFMGAYPGGYKAAHARGHDYMDEVFSHMVDRAPSDRDSIYIWKSIGEYFNRKQVYKVGVTSARLNGRRITQVARNVGVKAEVIALRKVRITAELVEGSLLALGDDPQFVERDGATEFRALSDVELEKALAIIEHYQEGDDKAEPKAAIDGTIPTSGRRQRDNEVRR